MPTYATHAKYELQRAAALTRRDGRPRWVETTHGPNYGRIYTHRPDAESVRVKLFGTVVAYTHQPARD